MKSLIHYEKFYDVQSEESQSRAKSLNGISGMKGVICRRNMVYATEVEDETELMKEVFCIQ